ncbi:MAG TPA: decarboxylating NADP(+)-dependent phosphogluconate dehydrogenase [Acidimicrobiia bacterium]|nr:decarboxylating NADP(+)-dependent phosphogluconate dehydrogenase [Acidimicrobiia bacterium]
MLGTADIAVAGLGVMGANLALNLADRGHRVAAYNRTTSVTDEFMTGEAGDLGIIPAATIDEMVRLLERPRVVLVMVTAGKPVDAVIESLLGHLEEGDIIIDGGNSLYADTDRRQALVESRGLSYLGMGVSGGEEGARHGPSIMPGGSRAAWEQVEPMLKSIAARAPDGKPCCEWMGPGGAGHFVKMVHNGIEYGDMQVIAEAYDLMRRGMGMTAGEMSKVFARWDEGRLRSYLIEITSEILSTQVDGGPIVDLVLDAAGQKGTGKWTVVSSMDLGQPTTLVGEAVYARIVSSDPDARKRAAQIYDGPVGSMGEVGPDDVESALYASKIISYAQGFRLMRAASDEFGWDLDLGTIASIWRAGCIIRAVFLEDITAAFQRDPGLPDMIEDDFFAEALKEAGTSWREVVAGAARAGLPVPAYSSALSYFDGMRSERLPANLIQAQRDFFGAHTFERVDRPRGDFFHHDWSS